jgi:hypothetical protein
MGASGTPATRERAELTALVALAIDRFRTLPAPEMSRCSSAPTAHRTLTLITAPGSPSHCSLDREDGRG